MGALRPGYVERFVVHPMRLSLNDKVVDVWVVDLQVPYKILQDAYDILSADELQRAQRFRFPLDSRRFVVARSTTRKILGRYLQTAPESIDFVCTEYGKPKVANPTTNLRFNVSRSWERALIACTMGHEVGIDIESTRRDLEIDELASRFFTVAENEKLLTFSSQHRQQAFLQCWTCKEAYVKGVGKGLSLDLDTFDVCVGFGNPGQNLSTSIEKFVVNGWSLMPVAANTGYVAALASEGEGEDMEVTVRSWVESEE